MEQTLPSPAEPAVAQPFYPTLKESWGAMGWLLLISLPVGGAALLATGGRIHAGSLGRQVGIVLASELSVLLTILWVRRRAGPLRWPGIALWGPQEKWQLYALLPVLVVALDVLLSTISLLHLPSPNEKLYHEIARYPVLFFGMGCVAAPILEEVLFRGVLLKGLLRNYRPAVAIGQTALLFGLLHMSPAQSLATALLGALLGWLYYRTRSLALCIGLHMVNNLFAINAMSHTRLAGSQDMLDLMTPTHYAGMLLLAALVLGSIIWWLQRTLPPVPMSVQEESSATGEAVLLPQP